MGNDYFFKAALTLARQAAEKNEVPIGAVIVLDGQIVGRGYNQTKQRGSSFYHAEIVALRQAQRKIGDFRLAGARLYVTLEPCLMCLGAALLSRIKEIHYILPDPTFGSFRSLLKKTTKGSYKGVKCFHHQERRLQDAVEKMMKSFFDRLRKKQQAVI